MASVSESLSGLANSFWTTVSNHTGHWYKPSTPANNNSGSSGSGNGTTSSSDQSGSDSQAAPNANQPTNQDPQKKPKADQGNDSGFNFGDMFKSLGAFGKILEVLFDVLTGNFAALGMDVAGGVVAGAEGTASKAVKGVGHKIAGAWDSFTSGIGRGVRSGISRTGRAFGWKAPPATAAIIIDAAKKFKVDPKFALTVTGVESHWDANAYNGMKNSHAAGLGQFEPGTWEAYGKGFNPFDPQANAEAFARMTADNQNKLQSALGRGPSNSELYAAQMFGSSGALHIIQAGDSTTARDALVAAGMKSTIVDDAIRNNLSGTYKSEHPNWQNEIGTMSATALLNNAKEIYGSKEAPILEANADILGGRPSAPNPSSQPSPLIAENKPAPSLGHVPPADAGGPGLFRLTPRDNAPVKVETKVNVRVHSPKTPGLLAQQPEAHRGNFRQLSTTPEGTTVQTTTTAKVTAPKIAATPAETPSV